MSTVPGLRGSLSTALLLVTTSVCAAASDPTPADVVNRFYTWRLHGKTYGAPGNKDLAQMRPMLTPRLFCLLDATRRYEENAVAEIGKYERAHPGERLKPPLVEGDFYSSAGFDELGRFVIERASVETEAATVDVHFFSTQVAGRAEEWTDQVVLRHLNGQWRIDDIVYDRRRTAAGDSSLAAYIGGIGRYFPDWDSKAIAACR